MCCVSSVSIASDDGSVVNVGKDVAEGNGGCDAAEFTYESVVYGFYSVYARLSAGRPAVVAAFASGGVRFDQLSQAHAILITWVCWCYW